MMEGTLMAKSRFLGVALLFFASSCDDVEPCAVPGSAEVCSCAPGAQGARVCEAEHTWSDCNCSGAIPLPNPVIPLDAGGGRGGGAGSAGSTGTGGAGAGGMGGGTPAMDGGEIDDDGGVDPADAGGTGGMGGAGGMGGMEPENPYGPCANNGDCRMAAECTITPNFPADANVCAPRCTATSDCPVPAGMYDAVVTCVTGFCRLDCTPVVFQPLLSCPAGMVCVSPLFGSTWCHDDGM